MTVTHWPSHVARRDHLTSPDGEKTFATQTAQDSLPVSGSGALPSFSREEGRREPPKTANPSAGPPGCHGRDAVRLLVAGRTLPRRDYLGSGPGRHLLTAALPP